MVYSTIESLSEYTGWCTNDVTPGASWITQLNDLSACQLANKADVGTSRRFPCNGRRKLSVGMWPLSSSPQVGVSSVATVATLFGGPYWVDTYFPAQLCVWDMFGETQIRVPPGPFSPTLYLKNS